jgi:hypothetical protein
VYWKPVWHMLDGSFQLLLANAAHIKGIARPKTTCATPSGSRICSRTG